MRLILLRWSVPNWQMGICLAVACNVVVGNGAISYKVCLVCTGILFVRDCMLCSNTQTLGVRFRRRGKYYKKKPKPTTTMAATTTGAATTTPTTMTTAPTTMTTAPTTMTTMTTVPPTMCVLLQQCSSTNQLSAETNGLYSNLLSNLITATRANAQEVSSMFAAVETL